MKLHTRTAIITLLILSILPALGSCNRKQDYEHEKEAALKKREALFKSQIKSDYTIEGDYETPEKAIEAFANALVKKGADAAEQTLYSETEYREIYWPNELPEYNMMSAVPPEAAWTIQKTIRDVLLPSIAQRFRNKTAHYKVITLKIKKREHRNALELLLPEEIVLTGEGQRVGIPEIRTIIQHHGRYKISSIWKEED